MTSAINKSKRLASEWLAELIRRGRAADFIIGAGVGFAFGWLLALVVISLAILLQKELVSAEVVLPATPTEVPVAVPVAVPITQTPVPTRTPTSTPSPTLTPTETLQPTPTQYWPPGVVPQPSPATPVHLDALHWWEVADQKYSPRQENKRPECPVGKPVSNRTWMQVYPRHTIGLSTFYAPGVMEHQCTYRAIDCYGGQWVGGVALMSPANLLDTVYLRPPGEGWQGPYVVVDTSTSHDFCNLVYHWEEVIEVDWQTWQRWGRGFGNGGLVGVEVWVGEEPPQGGYVGRPVRYWPELFWPFEAEAH